jgi:hypothetical protein
VSPSPDICPFCGAEVPPKARACPECGSSEETGWAEQAATDALNLPDQEFNYEEFVQREFERPSKVVPHGIPWFWWLVAVGLLGCGVILWFG